MKKSQMKRVSNVNFLVIVITLLLFVLALVTKGITHDFLLEAAVFLVSVKLILATVYIRIHIDRIEEKLDILGKKLLEK